jgi:hypothetical protein
LRYNEQFTNASLDIKQAKSLVHKVIYEYAMSEDFIVTPQKEETLLRELVTEVTALLKTLDKALNEVSIHLLNHENITHQECQVILKELF